MRLTDTEYAELCLRDKSNETPGSFQNLPIVQMQFRLAVETVSRIYNASEEEVLCMIIDFHGSDPLDGPDSSNARRSPMIYTLIAFAAIVRQPDFALTTFPYYLYPVFRCLERWAKTTLYALSGQQVTSHNSAASMRKMYLKWVKEAGGREALLEVLVSPRQMPAGTTQAEKSAREVLLRKMGESEFRLPLLWSIFPLY